MPTERVGQRQSFTNSLQMSQTAASLHESVTAFWLLKTNMYLYCQISVVGFVCGYTSKTFIEVSQSSKSMKVPITFLIYIFFFSTDS